MHDVFRKLASSSGFIGRQTFLRDVLGGDAIPGPVADSIHQFCVACFIGVGSSLHHNGGGGGAGNLNGSLNNGTAATAALVSTSSTSSRGLNFRQTLTVLVLLTRGSHEEKIRCK